MKEYSKEQLVQEFGKSSWSNIMWAGDAKYISGIDIFEEYATPRYINLQSSHIAFYKYEHGLTIELSDGWKSIKVGIKNEEIKYITIEPQEQITVNKEKSVVGRALLGGLLLGPLGAVIGGVSGVGSKTIKLGDNPDNIMVICLDYHGVESFIMFSVANKKYNAIESKLKEKLSDKYKTPDEVSYNHSNKKTSTSIADEILKLKQLLDVGVLTQEEFDTQKQKLLIM